MIKSHDKYKSMILVGLAPVEKASSGFLTIIDLIGESGDLW